MPANDVTPVEEKKLHNHLSKDTKDAGKVYLEKSQPSPQLSLSEMGLFSGQLFYYSSYFGGIPQTIALTELDSENDDLAFDYQVAKLIGSGCGLFTAILIHYICKKKISKSHFEKSTDSFVYLICYLRRCNRHFNQLLAFALHWPKNIFFCYL